MVHTASLSSSRGSMGGRAETGAAMTRSGESKPLGTLVEWLAGFGVTDHWVVSCYLKLEPRDRSRGKYLIKLKNRMREQLARFEQRGASRQQRDAVERDLARVREHLEGPGNLPSGRGIAIFACEALGLFEAIPLPRVFRSRLLIDRSPLIRELAALNDEFGRVLCAAYDRTSARFFDVTASGIHELPALAPSDTTRAGRFHGPRSPTGTAPGAGSAGEHNFHQRIREEKQRHYAAVAQRLFELSRDRAIRGVVLAGIGVGSEAVEPHLHPYVGRQLLGSVRLNPKAASPSSIMEAALEVRAESERRFEAEHLAALREGLGTGWAVNGVEEVLRALRHGQVRTLIVEPTAEQRGFRCTATGRLGLTEATCEAEGRPEAVPDVIDEAIEEALRQGGHVDVVEDGAARAGVAGLAALLRFRQR
jgi:peptide chain release factor subunit 1